MGLRQVPVMFWPPNAVDGDTKPAVGAAAAGAAADTELAAAPPELEQHRLVLSIVGGKNPSQIYMLSFHTVNPEYARTPAQRVRVCSWGAGGGGISHAPRCVYVRHRAQVPSSRCGARPSNADLRVERNVPPVAPSVGWAAD